MGQVILPFRNVTGDNLWSEVEANDDAIAGVVNGQISNDNIQAGADINGAKLLDGSVGRPKIPANAIDNGRLDDNAVQARNIVNNQVTSDKVNLSAYIDGSGTDTSTSFAAPIADLQISVPAGHYMVFYTIPVLSNAGASGYIRFFHQSTPLGDGHFSMSSVNDIQTVSFVGVQAVSITTIFSAWLFATAGGPTAQAGARVAALRIG